MHGRRRRVRGRRRRPGRPGRCRDGVHGVRCRASRPGRPAPCVHRRGAVAAGVAHLVYTSFYGAAPDATFTLARDHWATEEHIRASGLAFTFLRDNLYADFLPLMADEHGVIRGPAGDGRVAAVAIDDVADGGGRGAAATRPRTPVPPTTSPARRRSRLPRSRRSCTAAGAGPVTLPGRDARRGVRVPGGVRRADLAGRRLGQHLHGDRQRRVGHGDRRRPTAERHPATSLTDLLAADPSGSARNREPGVDARCDPVRVIRPQDERHSARGGGPVRRACARR